MGTFASLREAQEYFRGDHFATDNGAELIDMDDEKVTCAMTLTERHRNANGGVMGGAIFTLADFAFAVMANQIHMPTVAQQISISHLNAPKGKRLIAEARVRKNGRTSTVIIVDVSDDNGRDIAQFVGTGFKLEIRT